MIILFLKLIKFLKCFKELGWLLLKSVLLWNLFKIIILVLGWFF